MVSIGRCGVFTLLYTMRQARSQTRNDEAKVSETHRERERERHTESERVSERAEESENEREKTTCEIMARFRSNYSQLQNNRKHARSTRPMLHGPIHTMQTCIAFCHMRSVALYLFVFTVQRTLYAHPIGFEWNLRATGTRVPTLIGASNSPVRLGNFWVHLQISCNYWRIF